MKIFEKLCLTSLLFGLALPAFANPTVNSPYNGSTVGTAFTVSAADSSCSGQPISSIGFSMDASTHTVSVSGSAINTWASAGAGGHTLHFKSWGNKGAVCTTDIAITVSSGASSSGGPSVSSPVNGATVASPFTLAAYQSSCNGQPVATIGYSGDDSNWTYTTGGSSLKTSVSMGAGGHTVHVKAWGNGGASCVTNVAVNVSGGSLVPAGATSVGNLQATGYWSSVHDSAAGGSSSGWTAVTSSPSRTGSARHFSTSYSSYGAQRYARSFGDDTAAHNFVYDTWVFIQDTAAGIANIEMDLNQVIGNGWTVIMGVQCDGWSGTWDFTANRGSATSPNDQWVHSGARCNPKSWAVNSWHHVQIAYSRDDNGNVLYQTAAIDGATQAINAKVFSGFALGWSPAMMTNFQLDGGTSSSYGSNVFIDDLTISRW